MKTTTQKEAKPCRARMSLHLCIAAVLGAGALGCQDYEFNPLRPVTFRQASQFKKVVAQPLKPNLMLMVDRSYSMGINNIQTASGPRSRWQELQTAMAEYLDGYKTPAGRVARLGLVMFPSGDACEPGVQTKYWVDLK